jgi:tripartite-type tricarboxylate transporter receptor subunit TctC
MDATRKTLIRFGLVMATSVNLQTSAVADQFPSRAVRITVPFSAAAGPTIFLHALGDKLSKRWRHQVIIDPKPGASGFLAIRAVKGAAADGYELLAMSNAHATINPTLHKTLPYDPQQDFVPVAMLYYTPYFFAVSAAGPYKTIPSLIAEAKAHPDKITYGSSFVGSPPHLGSAMFAYLTQTRMTHVPFTDQGQLYVALVRGDVSWALSTVGTALPFTQSRQVKLIAVAARERLKSTPDIPTVEEAGGPAQFDVNSWISLFAPRGTQPDVIRRLNEEIGNAMRDSDIQERLKLFGFEPFPISPEEIVNLIRVETVKYGELVRRAGISAE